jgi:pyruvate dehydrogenase E1 component
VVSVIDGHPSALSWVGSMLGVRAWPLGVTRYGESGTRADLYRDHGIDAASIRRAAQAALADRP